SDVERAVHDVNAAGVVVIAAAGNSADALPEPPAAAPDAIAVGGEDDGNTRETGDDVPWSSSAGSTHPGVHKPELLAPAIRLAAPMLPGTITAREANALFHARSVLEEVLAEQTFSDVTRPSDDETA